MIDRNHRLSVTRQARMLGISRASVYYIPRPVSEADLKLMRAMDELHLEYPFAGSRMLRDLLRQDGFEVGRKQVTTLMKRMGIEALYRKPRTTRRYPEHRVYPYLLRGMDVCQPNQVWAMDITYSAPVSRRHPGRCCRGASMSGMHSNLFKEETRRMPAVCYEIARAEAEVTCRTLAG